MGSGVPNPIHYGLRFIGAITGNVVTKLGVRFQTEGGNGQNDEKDGSDGKYLKQESNDLF